MKILTLTPGRGSICKEQRDMLMKLAVLLARRGDQLGTCDETTSGMLAHSRNVLLGTLAKRADVDWALWIDTDCSWNPQAILDMSLRPESMIVWNYPVRVSFDLYYPPERLQQIAEQGRSKPRRWPGTALMKQSVGQVWSDDRKLIELDQCAFGAVLMRREVALQMESLLPACAPDWDGRHLVPAFEVLQHRVGEDYSFCRRYRRAGGRIWCDPSVYVTNGAVGGRFADEIERCRGVVQRHPLYFAVTA